MEIKWVVNRTNSELRGSICILPRHITGWALCAEAIVRYDWDREKGNISMLPLCRWAAATRIQLVYRWLGLARAGEFHLPHAKRNTLTLTATRRLYVAWLFEVQIGFLYREETAQRAQQYNTNSRVLIKVVGINFNWISSIHYSKCTTEPDSNCIHHQSKGRIQMMM